LAEYIVLQMIVPAKTIYQDIAIVLPLAEPQTM
jgi:hypothetical protein